jgi:hypothetical protein
VGPSPSEHRCDNADLAAKRKRLRASPAGLAHGVEAVRYAIRSAISSSRETIQSGGAAAKAAPWDSPP